MEIVHHQTATKRLWFKEKYGASSWDLFSFPKLYAISSTFRSLLANEHKEAQEESVMMVQHRGVI